jgi:hypothetical protein
MLNFSPLSTIPDKIYEGQQRRRTTDLQNAFPDGLPRTPDGKVDVESAADTLTKLGGAEFAKPFIDQFMGLQIGENAKKNLVGPAGGDQPAVKPINSSAAGPANIMGGATKQPQSATTQPFDNSSADTVRGLATEVFGGRDVSQLLPRYAAALKVNPDQPLSPDQIAQARAFMSRTAQSMGNQTTNDAGSGTQPAPASGASGSPAPTGQPAQPQRQPQAVPPTGIPAQAPQQQGQPVQPQGQQQPQGPSGNGAVGIPLAQYPDAMKHMQDRETELRGLAAQYAGLKPAIADQFEKQAASMQATRLKMQEEYQGVLAPTSGQKDVATNVAGQQETQKSNAQQGAKLFAGISGAAQEARRNGEYLTLAKSILSNPDMYSGFGADRVLDANKLKLWAGGDPKRAMLMEGLQKINASSVLSQLNQQRDEIVQETGGTSGRIFAQQVDQINKASPSLEGTMAGNRFLVEVQNRNAQLAKEIERQALDYRASHRDALDRGFYVQMGKYLDTHPLFNEQELTHPELLGAVDIPPGFKSKEQVGAWMRAMQLRPGEAMRTPDGKYKMAPP